MKHNTHSDFVGLQKLKERHGEQLRDFEKWASDEHWINFHLSHYDWWMFPIDQPSSYGFAWTVFEGDIEGLKRDDAYIRGYLRGAELLTQSWGWDMLKSEYMPNPKPDQKWANWPIRLFKASKSLKLFGYLEDFESMKTYANDLMKKGANMEFNGRDLSWLFR